MRSYFDTRIRMVSISYNGLLFVCFLLLYQFSFAQATSVSPKLLPGAKVYNVTKPETYGGTLAATPNNATDDDALAINEALQAAVNYISSKGKSKGAVFQQVILIPKGDYHLGSSIIVPRVKNDKENAI